MSINKSGIKNPVWIELQDRKTFEKQDPSSKSVIGKIAPKGYSKTDHAISIDKKNFRPIDCITLGSNKAKPKSFFIKSDSSHSQNEQPELLSYQQPSDHSKIFSKFLKKANSEPVANQQTLERLKIEHQSFDQSTDMTTIFPEAPKSDVATAKQVLVEFAEGIDSNSKDNLITVAFGTQDNYLLNFAKNSEGETTLSEMHKLTDGNKINNKSISSVDYPESKKNRSNNHLANRLNNYKLFQFTIRR